MVEFFNNIFNWFVEHKDEIVLFFTSANFATFVSAVVLLIKSISATKASTNKVTDVSNSLNPIADICGNVEKLTETSDIVDAKIATVNEQLSNFKNEMSETLNVMQQKVQAMLEVQSIVYSNFTDDVARKNILNILTTAKFAETSVVANLEKQIEELTTLVDNKVNDVKDTVEEVTNKVRKTVSSTKTTPRY